VSTHIPAAPQILHYRYSPARERRPRTIPDSIGSDHPRSSPSDATVSPAAPRLIIHDARRRNINARQPATCYRICTKLLTSRDAEMLEHIDVSRNLAVESQLYTVVCGRIGKVVSTLFQVIRPNHLASPISPTSCQWRK